MLRIYEPDPAQSCGEDNHTFDQGDCVTCGAYVEDCSHDDLDGDGHCTMCGEPHVEHCRDCGSEPCEACS